MTARIPDDDGARWPITGRWCPACAMPTSHEDVHPTCQPPSGPAPPPTDAQLAGLAELLGAEPIGTFHTRWPRTGEQLPHGRSRMGVPE